MPGLENTAYFCDNSNVISRENNRLLFGKICRPGGCKALFYAELTFA